MTLKWATASKNALYLGQFFTYCFEGLGSQDIQEWLWKNSNVGHLNKNFRYKIFKLLRPDSAAKEQWRVNSSLAFLFLPRSVISKFLSCKTPLPSPSRYNYTILYISLPPPPPLFIIHTWCVYTFVLCFSYYLLLSPYWYISSSTQSEGNNLGRPSPSPPPPPPWRSKYRGVEEAIHLRRESSGQRDIEDSRIGADRTLSSLGDRMFESPVENLAIMCTSSKIRHVSVLYSFYVSLWEATHPPSFLRTGGGGRVGGHSTPLKNKQEGGEHERGGERLSAHGRTRNKPASCRV